MSITEIKNCVTGEVNASSHTSSAGVLING